MRWVTCQHGHGLQVGLVVDDAVHVLDDDRTLIDVISAGQVEMERIAETVRRSPATVVPLESMVLHSPIPQPPSVRDTVGFLDHVRGCRRAYGRDPELGEVWSRVPAFYFANPATLFGARDDVAIAPGSRWFDFELEVAAVIGTPGSDLDPVAAQDAIAGYMLFCDWTARDLQQADMALGIGQGKGKDSGMTFGPWLVTADEVANRLVDGRLDLEVAVEVNGVEIARGTTGAMDWTFGEIVSFVSRGTRLVPGDVIGSGTIPGGCLLEHLVGDPETYDGWLKPGDTVSLDSRALGRTHQRIVDGARPHPLSSGY
ncbi:fumarylacetoacetate hydrolase family protein [Streptomyces malaysiensis]|uniref:Fumarylacetoacetate hydrolase family protein n=1 Tax=Streptomyces malaysiensis subsp. samsunensis TaxID=459658 RepID=A0A9X2M581_STRMQ|nr:fumarylacetoacetate hydrolase family protein [Streptomyces samsunensis]MCQ8835951.1 fumarylacetoacetate hydrolase family protein [Streptomyces samsunensis]